jgi:hypothetical protein
MSSFALHFGSYSAIPGQRPERLIDVFRHNEGWAVWIGPVGLVTYKPRRARSGG